MPEKSSYYTGFIDIVHCFWYYFYVKLQSASFRGNYQLY